jgi:hypothetical protein
MLAVMRCLPGWSCVASLLAFASACAGSGERSPVFGEDAGVESGPGPDAASTADGPPHEAGGDTGVGSLLGDGSSADSGACKHLNIGILGNPGANPSSDFQAWLVSAGTSVQRIQTTAPTPTLAATDLQPFDVVILDWLTRDYAAAEATVMSEFISAGGGLISMSGYDNVTTDDWHANSLLAPLAVAYTGALLNGPVTSFAPHPITAGLTSVTFEGGYEVADLGGTASTRTPIAFLPGPVTVGMAVQLGNGHAFVWGDEWIQFDSEWSTLPEIKQLWVQVFAWVSPPNTCGLHPPQ